MIVVDASVLVTALFDDGQDGDTARGRLRGETLTAPEIIDLEVASVLRQASFAGPAASRRATLAMRDLEEMPLRREPHVPLLARCWELRATVTPHDAAYVALAEYLDVVLVTADARLARSHGPNCELELLV